jgi:hypothetical protein
MPSRYGPAWDGIPHNNSSLSYMDGDLAFRITLLLILLGLYIAFRVWRGLKKDAKEEVAEKARLREQLLRLGLMRRRKNLRSGKAGKRKR